jgi:hypothetical protein
MKFRLVLLLFAALLPMAALAHAASTATVDQTVTLPASIAAAAGAPSDCAADRSAAAKPVAAFLGAYCGGCSDSKCQNHQIGQYCTPPPGYVGGFSCQNVYGNSCPVDGAPDCRCWTGPLP